MNSPPHVAIWLVHYPSITDLQLLHRYRRLLSAEELEQLERCPARLQVQRLITRAALRCSLSLHAPDLMPDQWIFARTEQGKPYITNPRQTLHFSLSHSGDWLAIGVCAQRPLGIDLERHRARRPILAIAENYFCPEEVAQLKGLAPRERQARFLTLWTLKEAWLKAKGTGLSAGLNSIYFDTNNCPTFANRRDQNSVWRFNHYQLNADYHLAVASQQVDSPIQLRQFTPLGAQSVLTAESTSAKRS